MQKEKNMSKGIFSFLSRRNDERKAVNETVSVSGESMEQKESNFMENENKNPINEETKKDEVVEEKVDEKIETTENQNEKPVENGEEKENGVENTAPTQVENTTPTGNGIPLDQVATKDYVKEMFDSLGAKIEALLNENTSLKNQLDEKKGEVSAMKDKYEDKDFGGFSKQGVTTKDKNANDTFDTYSKQFM